jgi:hypothetical protein
MERLKACPDCKSGHVVRDRKKVYGMSCGITIECVNSARPGIRHGVNRYAYSDSEWNNKQPREPEQGARE